MPAMKGLVIMALEVLAGSAVEAVAPAVASAAGQVAAGATGLAAPAVGAAIMEVAALLQPSVPRTPTTRRARPVLATPPTSRPVRHCPTKFASKTNPPPLLQLSRSSS